jgi:branched-chain amino acid transport system ATP-binding protein
MLRVDKLNFSYGEIQVLTDVSLHVKDREFVVIFGPNGHGKSTLLKTICGLLSPASGSIEYEGEKINGIGAQKIVEMGLVYIAEDRHLFPDMDVSDNLMMGAYNTNARAKERENRDLVFELFPRLRDLKKQVASSLSGGEARMLAIGRGLMSNAKFLAFDEPSLGLAPNLRTDVLERINEIRKKGASILLVEQSTPLAADCADRIYILEDGKIVFDGNKDEVMDNEEMREIFIGI